ncbi:uncharacterized protein LOC116249080 [Nymphaea colorata]|uniref:uncharacterized protein LOC116249080 n=1 Tax=Nymphaea colorata TaxID=210225 RepID=UPI00129D4A00|nr:uncharacterized protein LOC116249080 [Nymphaea colorata]
MIVSLLELFVIVRRRVYRVDLKAASMREEWLLGKQYRCGEEFRWTFWPALCAAKPSVTVTFQVDPQLLDCCSLRYSVSVRGPQLRSSSRSNPNPSREGSREGREKRPSKMRKEWKMHIVSPPLGSPCHLCEFNPSLENQRRGGVLFVSLLPISCCFWELGH